MKELNLGQRIELIRSAYPSPDEVDLSVFHPEVEVRDPTRPDTLDPSGIYRGQHGMWRYAEDWYESWEQFEITPEAFAEFGDRVVARVRASGRARASGIELENERFHVYGFRDGKIASLEIHPDLASARQAAEAAAGPPR